MAVIIILILVIVSSFLEFFGHGWQGDSFGKIGQRVDEASLLIVVMVKGASLAELAFTVLLNNIPQDIWDGALKPKVSQLMALPEPIGCLKSPATWRRSESLVQTVLKAENHASHVAQVGVRERMRHRAA